MAVFVSCRAYLPRRDEDVRNFKVRAAVSISTGKRQLVEYGARVAALAEKEQGRLISCYVFDAGCHANRRGIAESLLRRGYSAPEEFLMGASWEGYERTALQAAPS